MPSFLHEYLKITSWVLVPIACGVLLSRLGVPKRAARGFFAFAFYACQTFVTAGAIWTARIQAEARLLPVLTLGGWLFTLGLAWLVSRKWAAVPARRGAFIVSMAMSNNGFTLLGFIALSAFGEAGLSQATYAQLLYTPFFLLCCFPIARAFGSGTKGGATSAVLTKNLVDPRVWVPLLAIGLGLSLNAGHVLRPSLVSKLIRLLILLGTASSSCAVGLLFSGFHWRRYWRENLISLVYRSSFYPLCYWGLATVAHLRRLDTVILVLYGLMPSALLASMLAVFFELDAALTSSVFMVSTLSFLVFVLPVFLTVIAH